MNNVWGAACIEYCFNVATGNTSGKRYKIIKKKYDANSTIKVKKRFGELNFDCYLLVNICQLKCQYVLCLEAGFKPDMM